METAKKYWWVIAILIVIAFILWKQKQKTGKYFSFDGHENYSSNKKKQ